VPRTSYKYRGFIISAITCETMAPFSSIILLNQSINQLFIDRGTVLPRYSNMHNLTI